MYKCMYVQCIDVHVHVHACATILMYMYMFCAMFESGQSEDFVYTLHWACDYKVTYVTIT